ncbi:MAG: FMN-dependent NADH-azoreductase [Cyanobacteriota bacterium]|nr:FMN-dependent NADH-azoreductase [Cyanobacteriota bacterium]
MARILHIDSSPRGKRSMSRALSQEFIDAWKNSHPEDKVQYRDLGHHPVPHVDENWIAAAYSSPETHTPELAAAIKISEDLIEEFLESDRFVFGIPMYNLSVPSTFKAYIDQIVRVKRTFVMDENGYRGLVDSSKKMLIIVTRGGSFQPGTPAEAYDFQAPYLRGIFGFIGIKDITFIYAENMNQGEELKAQSLADARAKIKELVSSW